MEVNQYDMHYKCSTVAGTGNMERTLYKRVEGEMMGEVRSALSTT